MKLILKNQLKVVTTIRSCRSLTTMTKDIAVYWSRRDLRLDDNAALNCALQSGLPVLVIFIFDSEILKKLKNPIDRRVDFIHQALEAMNAKLHQLGSSLYVEHASPLDAWKKILKNLKTEKLNVKKVFFAKDYEPKAISRDIEVTRFLQSQSIDVTTVKDQVLFEEREVTKDDKKPYTVFTPYKNKWLSCLKPNHYKSYDTEKHFNGFLKNNKFLIKPLNEIGFKKTDLVYTPPQFDSGIIKTYDATRNFPALANGTTRMGVHLRFGTISPRQCVQVALKKNDTWLSELIWREFFMQILFHFPHVEENAFRPEYDKIQWRNNKSEFQAWCEGRTGYPIVDAGLRELNTTGYMHNRVRMIVGSFLVKDLLIDWRMGEKYFAERLLDYDLSANNGNWQWVAGTGCDAAPYFRIFNPEQQSIKFDPKNEYIKKWVPEWGTKDYPSPLVDHSMARQRTLMAYKKALQK